MSIASLTVNTSTSFTDTGTEEEAVKLGRHSYTPKEIRTAAEKAARYHVSVPVRVPEPPRKMHGSMSLRRSRLTEDQKARVQKLGVELGGYLGTGEGELLLLFISCLYPSESALFVHLDCEGGQ